LLESTYEICLEYELKKNGFTVEKQKSLPVKYDEVRLDAGYRIDLLVNNTIILELKSVESINDVHKAQLMTYLKLSSLQVGYLINFNVLSLKTGILRIVV
jgi:GxxExxY protein